MTQAAGRPDGNRDQEFLRWIGRHCVAVSWEDAEPGQANATGGFAFSAFIIAVRNLWYLVTAGHVIDDLNARLSQGREFRYAKIIDRWSIDAIDANPIPFPDIVNHVRAPQSHIYQEETGIDYALIFISEYYRNLLAANGMVPLDENAWKDVPSDLEAHIAFGFPDDCVTETRDAQTNRYAGLRIRPRLIPYLREMTPPQGFELKFPRLFFWPARDDTGQIALVNGVSGGPVFGFRTRAGQTRMWLVAVQSTQLEQSRLAIACPAEPFCLAIEQVIQEMIDREDTGGLENEQSN